MTRRPTAAAVLVVAAVLLAGCSSSGQEGRPTTLPTVAHAASPGAATPLATSRSPEPEGPDGDGQAKRAERRGKKSPLQDVKPSGPTVPKAELTPATGSFDRRQKEYLVDRVPRGMDPAAVLAAGQETCERITRTTKVDRKATIDAIRSGEIGGAKAAITHLCRQHMDLLRAAEH